MLPKKILERSSPSHVRRKDPSKGKRAYKEPQESFCLQQENMPNEEVDFNAPNQHANMSGQNRDKEID